MSNLTISQAASEAVGLGKQLQSIIRVGEFLQGIASLEQRKSEADAAADAAVTTAIDAIAKLADLQVEAGKVQSVVDEAYAEAAKAREQAAMDGAFILANARDEAEGTRQAARDYSAELVEKVRQDAHAHMERMTAWDAEEAGLEKRIAELKAQIANIKKNLTEAETGE